MLESRVTVDGERIFAERLCKLISEYWEKRGYDAIVVWPDQPCRSRDIADHKRAPIFRIRSNIGQYGYPPKMVAK